MEGSQLFEIQKLDGRPGSRYTVHYGEFQQFFKGNEPSPIQITASIVYCLCWMIFGYFTGYTRMRVFFTFLTLYWAVGAAYLIVAYYIDNFILSLPAVLIFVGPLYGLRYFVGGTYDLSLIFINITIVYGAGIIGFLLGYAINYAVKSKQ
ncbi:hypothetical protein PAECIP111893_01970 [Paenibacillus plantiphilus]|uniref:Uncharacterized protein n=1 Tax=Paenibacillus plantiphilus TaxID=2905650 RepID=A0ABM9C5R6_9BACL|nr:hypothetical protein [Paenibacillus plantiphilus]CAH1203450.1 hypothetical protein PAECIP111893_01970 [Paenibacillus plantiphilus]